VRKIEWAAANGLKGALIPHCEDKRAPHHHPRYEPIWAAAEANEITVGVHATPGRVWEYGGPGVDPLTVGMIIRTEVHWWGRRPLWLMIWGGVFERHPNLHLAMTELGGKWIPSTVAFLDDMVDYGAPAELAKTLPLKPSEYIARQVFFGVSFWSQAEVELRHDIGIDNMMFGVDFPHLEGSEGYTREWLAGTVGPNNLTEAEARKILGENCARCYRVDVDALTPTVERIGPTVDEILNGTTAGLPEHLLVRGIEEKTMRSGAHA
jgi:predicted TIM-barrel fold metal-dependent hydrolase